MEENKNEEKIEEVVNEQSQIENPIVGENKKCKSKKPFVIIIVVIAMALTFGCGIMLGKELFENKKSNNKKETEVIDNNQNEKNENVNNKKEDEQSPIESKEGKATTIHTSLKEKKGDIDYIYQPKEVDDVFGVDVTILDSGSDVEIFLDINKLNEMYQLNIGIDSFTKKLSFKNNVRQVFCGGFGQAVGEEYIFFVMDNGEVQYIPLYKELSRDNWINLSNDEKLNSYGTIEGVTNVVFLYGMNVVTGLSGYFSVGALRTDGSFYNLFEFIG